MNLTAIVGTNWGDEGKGRMVDLISKDYDIICRYQGGNNAGHTVINERGKFILNLLPSGVLRENTVNVLGGGMVIDIEHLSNEINSLMEKGIKISPCNLKISNRAFISMPYHKAQDILEENRLKDKKYGSTLRGIAPCYSDKYLKKGIRLGDLLSPYENKLKDIVEYKNMIFSAYNEKNINLDEILNWLDKYSKIVKPFVTDTTDYLTQSIKNGKKILLEAQLGALRDIEYGIYPFTTSSPTLSSYATTGAGIPCFKLDKIVGVMKAYSSCVGEGAFVVEMQGNDAEKLREAGEEYGATTGRPRRVGAFDVPASRYGVFLQGVTELALTKLDTLSYLDKIPVCVAYEINGKLTKNFPFGDDLYRAKPVYEYLDGFKTDISKCRKQSDLPKNALDYIKYIEKAVDCPIKYVSVGAKREDYLLLN